MLRPDLRSGGARPPNLADGLYQFSAPRKFEARKAVLLKEVTKSSAEDARGVALNVRVNWSHASAREIKLILVDGKGANERLLDFVGDVESQREVC